MQEKSLSFLTLFLLISLSKCEIKSYSDSLSTETESSNIEVDESFVDNRIDELPTYVPFPERFLKTLAKGLENLSAEYNLTENSTGVKKIINEVTKPITIILKPVGKTTGRALNSSGIGEILNIFKDNFRVLYPGTLWCGAGDSSKSEEEIGFFKVTDACCRDHDHCKSTINAGRSAKGLRNDGLFTRSHCDCDDEFYRCLKKAHSPIATKIGITYFNILRPQCFKEDYPATCLKYGFPRISRNKCKEYEIDRSKNMTLQWFDVPDF